MAPLPTPHFHQIKYLKNSFLTIPFQSFEIENTYVLPPQVDFKGRNYIQLCYKDSSVEIQDLPILTPPLNVHHYDIKKSMLFLEIDTSHPFYQKFHRFQEYIIQTFYNYQNILFETESDLSSNYNSDSKNIKIFLTNQNFNSIGKQHNLKSFRSTFQMPLRDNIFGFHIHPNTEIKLGDNSASSIRACQLQYGSIVRLLIRFYNILDLKCNPATKKIMRIQHSVPSIWHVSSPPKINRNLTRN